MTESSFMSTSAVPKGNTQFQVTSVIYDFLLSQLKGSQEYRVLDLPCGAGDFLKYLSEKHPDLKLEGAEIVPFPEHKQLKNVQLHSFNLSKGFRLPSRFNMITSISGVMEFENTATFCESCFIHLEPGGYFVVTNDNIWTMRDRLSFLFFGKTKRFRLCLSEGTPTYKYISIQNLHRILIESGFKIEDVKYTSIRLEDWLMIPLAFAIFLFQWPFVQLEKTAMPKKTRRMLFPFRALLARHYVIFAKKAGVD